MGRSTRVDGVAAVFLEDLLSDVDCVAAIGIELDVNVDIHALALRGIAV